jgi:hypothetical protein
MGSTARLITRRKVMPNLRPDSVRFVLTGFVAGLALAVPLGALAGNVTFPSADFQPSTTISSSQVNGKFAAVKSAVDDNHGRISTLEGVNAGSRLGALEGLNAGNRLTTLEGVNAANRLSALEGINAAARLSSLEGLNAGARLTSLEAINAGTRLAALEFQPSEVVASRSSGFGSSGTQVRVFEDVTVSGTSISHESSTSLGNGFRVNATGVYALTYIEVVNGAGLGKEFGFSRNASAAELAQDIRGLAFPSKRLYTSTHVTSSNGYKHAVGVTVLLQQNDVVRPHVEDRSNTYTTASNADVSFRITRVH